jgi:hypothetical protein
MRHLQIVWPKGMHRLCVLFFPDCDCEDLALSVVPLNEWLSGRSVWLWRPHQAEHRSGDRKPKFARAAGGDRDRRPLRPHRSAAGPATIPR